MRLDDIDWTATLRAARARQATENGSVSVLADAESLSALFSSDFSEANSRIARARLTEPLNPIHVLRLVLLNLRFGQWDAALALSQTLQEELAGLALPLYLRGLATLRQEEFKRAANIAQDLITAHPNFAPARFLQAEANLRTAGKGVKKILIGLPKGPVHAPAWADLAIKLALSGSDEGAKLAAQLVADPTVLPAGSGAQALAGRFLEMSAAKPESLEQQLATVADGSRAEEVLLLVLHDHLQKDVAAEAATSLLRGLVERFPERRTIRRLYVSWLTRLAIAEAGESHYAEALSLVERSLAIEPHETAHYQNRAALFTLMREAEAYHDAWFALNRHQYRLALLGKLTPADALRLAKPHRLFAQQARRHVDNPGSPSAQEFGVFKETRRAQDGDNVTAIVVNQELINEDVDLLRQWLHHHRAELIFSHWALGGDPFRFLLHPENARQATARCEGLALGGKSLAILVPEEGKLLAQRMLAIWQGLLPHLGASYTLEADDAEVLALQVQYVETLADVAVLCLTWQPDANRPEVVEEVLEFLSAVGPFFDEHILYKVLKDPARQPSYPVRLFANYVEDMLGVERGRDNLLNTEQRGRVLRSLAGDLLTTTAYRTYDAFHGGGDGVRQALTLAERARKLNPDSIHAQLAAARFLLMAGYYDEARAALALVQRSPRARDEQIAAQVDEIKKVLDERKKADPGLQRDHFAEPVPTGPHGDRLLALEQEIEKFPTSIQAYEEIIHLLAANGRFQEGLDWSERAIAQCLGRDVQVRARAANLEILGLSELSRREQSVIRLYLTGAHRPALEVLQALPEHERTYPLVYLLGNCQLAVNRPEEAQQSFEWALQHCDRQLHRAVLRRLASDIDQPYLMVARRAIHNSLESGAYENALRAAADLIAHLSKPEVGFLDLARVHLGAALARAGMNAEPLPRPANLEAGRWSSALATAYATASDLERARRLVNLSLEADPASTQPGEQLLQKINVLAEQVAIADALASSGDLLRRGQFDEALQALSGVGPSAEPRVVRQRALLLLKLERLDEADVLAESLRTSALPLAREFLASYPALAYRQRMNVACRLIREGADEKGLEVLTPAQASNDTEKIELGYCRAFCRTMAGYRHRRQGRKDEANRALEAAMEDIEPYVSAARATGHARLIELYETLDKELA